MLYRYIFSPLAFLHRAFVIVVKYLVDLIRIIYLLLDIREAVKKFVNSSECLFIIRTLSNLSCKYKAIFLYIYKFANLNLEYQLILTKRIRKQEYFLRLFSSNENRLFFSSSLPKFQFPSFPLHAFLLDPINRIERDVT